LDRDVDLYQVNATANQVLTATTSTPAGGIAMAPVLRVFDSAGNNLDTHYNATDSARYVYQFATAGTYYLGVSGANNAYYDPNVGGSGYAGQTGDYSL